MLSVLIVNWNTRDFLEACLDSIEKNPPSIESLEVVVVDNNSSDGSPEMVYDKFPSAKLIKSGGNVGYARGNNIAFANASGDLLLTLNADTEILEGTFDNAIDALKSHPDWGCLGAMQVHPTEYIQASVRGFPSLRGIIGDILGIDKGVWGSYRLKHFDYRVEQEAPQPMGTFLLFRQEALSELPDPKSPFDEQFPIFFNEVDLLFRLQKLGWKCGYSPKVVVKHYGGASTRQVRKSMIWESHRSLARFFQKHSPSPFLFLVKIALGLGALVRARGYHAGFRPEHPNL